MSIRSNRKWAAKESRADARIREHPALVSNEAHGNTGRAVLETKLKLSTAPEAHKLAAHTHFVAARVNREQAAKERDRGHETRALEHDREADRHMNLMAEHDRAASTGEWDEGKHPRDENGKFT